MPSALPPIHFASRGFVCHDGSVIGWCLLDAEHRTYHQTHGTTDADFATRWRQWSQGERIDIEEYRHPKRNEWTDAIEAWIEDHYDEVIMMPRA